jgi:hypothetical protein|tara:strand:+ start:430 stop:693 length:264 start_codon:yes stop_codon:yes gene_type:complete
MDIDIVIGFATTLLEQSKNYKAVDAQKTEITGQTKGALTINLQQKIVEGAEFVDVRDEWITGLASNLTTLNGTMDGLCDSIIVELAS